MCDLIRLFLLCFTRETHSQIVTQYYIVIYVTKMIISMIVMTMLQFLGSVSLPGELWPPRVNILYTCTNIVTFRLDRCLQYNSKNNNKYKLLCKV